MIISVECDARNACESGGQADWQADRRAVGQALQIAVKINLSNEQDRLGQVFCRVHWLKAVFC